jgi:hypothetical protein
MITKPTKPQNQPSAISAKIQPLLAAIPNSVIASQIGVSRWYAGRIPGATARIHVIGGHWRISSAFHEPRRNPR